MGQATEIAECHEPEYDRAHNHALEARQTRYNAHVCQPHHATFRYSQPAARGARACHRRTRAFASMQAVASTQAQAYVS